MKENRSNGVRTDAGSVRGAGAGGDVAGRPRPAVSQQARGPLPEDVAAHRAAERAYQEYRRFCKEADAEPACHPECAEGEREAQVRDRDLCRCGDQRAAHVSHLSPMVRECRVAQCPCTKFHVSGDNLEDSLKAWPADAEERLLDDVMALPLDKSPQQRWLAGALAMTRGITSLVHNLEEVITLEQAVQTGHSRTVVSHGIEALAAHLDAMPAPFDWTAVGEEIYHASYVVSSKTIASHLKRLWLGGPSAQG